MLSLQPHPDIILEMLDMSIKLSSDNEIEKAVQRKNLVLTYLKDILSFWYKEEEELSKNGIHIEQYRGEYCRRCADVLMSQIQCNFILKEEVKDEKEIKSDCPVIVESKGTSLKPVEWWQQLQVGDRVDYYAGSCV